MKLYKLTDAKGQTYQSTQWGKGITHQAELGKGELCSKYYIHAYTHPLLAIFLNPIHARFENLRLWEAKGRIAKRDHGLKVGCKSLTTICEIPCPEITQTQYMRFGILGVMKICQRSEFVNWAKRWLSGEDRSRSLEGRFWWPSFFKEFPSLIAEAAISAARAVYEPPWWDPCAFRMRTGNITAAQTCAAQAIERVAQAADINLAAIAEEAVTE